MNESKSTIDTEAPCRLERMRSPQIRRRIAEGWDTAVFACGAVEQHGPHLPLFMDAEHGDRLAFEVARRLGRTLVAPTIRVGCSEHHMAFAGTVSLRPETFEAIVTDYVASLARHKMRRILIVPTHGGNFAPLSGMLDRLRQAAATAAARGERVEAGPVVEAYTDLIGCIRLWRREAEAAQGRGDRVGGHADLAETSIMLALHPELVRMDLAEPGYMAEVSEEVINRIISDGFDSLAPNGILGDARGADAELGERLIGALADEVVRFFEPK